MAEIRLTYHGPVSDASGYGEAARAYIRALSAAGVALSVVNTSPGRPVIQDPLVVPLMNRSVDGSDFHLFHGIPCVWGPQAARVRHAIGMTVWETDAMPAEWSDALKAVIDVWVPCEFNATTFRAALQRPVFRLPHPVAHRALNGHTVDAGTLIQAPPTDFVFYSIFEWQERKGPTETLEAYFRAFPRDGDHLLVLKTNPSAVAVGQQAIERARVAARSTARVSLIAEGWSEAQIDALHRRGDCYVSLHRGEGWGYPLFEAAIRAKSIVATAYSGPLDYLTPQEAGLVPFTLAPVRQPYVYYRPSMMWAEPKVQDAAALMREAFGARKCAATGRAEYAERLQRSYSVAHVGAMAKDRLLQLLSMHNQPRWHEIHLHALPPPTVPISGDWYDEDYFESGLKSNWRNGYSWGTFGALFRETASYVIEMFPEAHSYLDAGCAKGLLVRALREAGKECRGFDHSAWAIEHADESARPFLRLAGVDDLTFDRHVDVLLAFDLFSQLSEEQARAFLVRVRQVTRMALVSVITSFEDDDEQLRYEGGGAADRDRSHVTRRQRRWWHTLFTESGWKLDALHRLGAERCQRHPLPTRMGWKMYVYAP